jgi:NCAIR mutase (PurE)-related protein
MSWPTTETPADLERRLREEQDAVQRARESRQAAEQEIENRQSSYVPKKTLGEIHDPTERQNFITAQRAEEKAKEEAHAARVMKESAKSAFIASGGKAEEFEAAYPALRELKIQQDALTLMKRENVGERLADGMISW